MSDMREFIAAATAGAPFGKHLGFECAELGDGRAVFRLPFREQNVTIGDMVHGGAIASLVDTAATAACWTTPDLPENPRGSTVGFSINYLDAARSAVAARSGSPMCGSMTPAAPRLRGRP
jgi:uncharacterized protein (TIGR00369 family)